MAGTMDSDTKEIPNVTFGPSSNTFKHMFVGISDDMQKAIENCAFCHQVCEQTLAHCLGNNGFESTHLKVLLDCAEICQTSTAFMVRESAYHHLTCGACAEICVKCAEACEEFDEDAIMKACAEACRRCAETCGAMAKSHEGLEHDEKVNAAQQAPPISQ